MARIRRKSGFASGEQLESWLSWPDEIHTRAVACAISSRSALRALPALADERFAEQSQSSIIPIFRAVGISWVSAIKSTREIERLAAYAYEAAARHQGKVPIAAAYAVAAAYAAAYSRVAGLSANAAAAAFEADARVEMWQALTSDVDLINSGESPEKLARAPLWDAGAPKWWVSNLVRFSDTLRLSASEQPNAANENYWEVWDKWIASRVGGEPSFGLPPESADKLDLRIALGDRRDDFWNRPASTINDEINGWLALARSPDVLPEPPEQQPGLRFALVDRLLRLVRGAGLGVKTPSDRIAAQVPILRGLVRRLAAKLSAQETPYVELRDSLHQIEATLTRSSPSEIGVSELFAEVVIFRDQLTEAQKPKENSNIRPFGDAELASAKSIATISDLIILATEEGQTLFQDADQSDLDAGEFDKYRVLELELLDRLATDGRIMDASELQLLKDFLIAGNRGPTPRRSMILSAGSMRNALFVLAGTGVIGGVGYAVYAVPVTALAIAFLGRLVLGEGIKKSKAGAELNEVIARLINRATVDFVSNNVELLRTIAGKRRSHQWLHDILDWAERNRTGNPPKT